MTDTERETIRAFIRRNRVQMSATWADHNPHMAESRDMDHWRVRLRVGRRSMSLFFSQGFGHNGKRPDTASVLSCLASDAASVDNAGSFEEWAREFGYDEDSRKAEKTYKACERQGESLRRLLGPEKYERLLYHTEPL